MLAFISTLFTLTLLLPGAVHDPFWIPRKERRGHNQEGYVVCPLPCGPKLSPLTSRVKLAVDGPKPGPRQGDCTFGFMPGQGPGPTDGGRQGSFMQWLGVDSAAASRPVVQAPATCSCSMPHATPSNTCESICLHQLDRHRGMLSINSVTLHTTCMDASFSLHVDTHHTPHKMLL
jgi:hypothetical protein